MCSVLPSSRIPTNIIIFQGPKSSISAPLPTTCFTDTILLPLPIFVLPFIVITTCLLARRAYDPSTLHIRARPLRTYGMKACTGLYYGFVIANILMEVLELVRLSLIHFGIGLLPLVIVALLVGGLFHVTDGLSRRVWKWQAMNLFLWTGGMVFSIIKTVGLAYEGLGTREGSKYPLIDQVTDTGVMAGVYAVLIVLESVLWWWQERRNPEEESLRSDTPELEGGRLGYGERFGRETK